MQKPPAATSHPIPNRPKTAMVLAAGLGERMRPLTLDRPKPLLEVGGKTLIDWTLDRFAAGGITDIVVNAHYKAEMLERHLQTRDDLKIRISREAERLETGGGIANALSLLGDAPFYVANSDSIWLDGPTPALDRLARTWDPARMDALLLLMSAPRSDDYEGPGDFLMDPDGRLTFRIHQEIARTLIIVAARRRHEQQQCIHPRRIPGPRQPVERRRRSVQPDAVGIGDIEGGVAKQGQGVGDAAAGFQPF